MLFKRNKNWKIRYQTIEESPDRKIEIEEGFTDNTINTTRKRHEKSYKTLVYFQDPDGNQKDLIKHMTSKTGIWSMHVNANTLTSQGTRLAFNQVLNPALTYGAPCMSILERHS